MRRTRLLIAGVVGAGALLTPSAAHAWLGPITVNAPVDANAPVNVDASSLDVNVTSNDCNVNVLTDAEHCDDD